MTFLGSAQFSSHAEKNEVLECVRAPVCRLSPYRHIRVGVFAL